MNVNAWMIFKKLKRYSINSKYYSRSSLVKIVSICFIINLILLFGENGKISETFCQMQASVNDTLIVEWQATEDIITHYVLHFNDITPDHQFSTKIYTFPTWQIDSDKFKIEPFIVELRPGNYDVFLTAVNEVGESGASNIIKLNIIPEIPNAPRNLILIIKTI